MRRMLVAGLLVYAATRPDRFRVERSAEINAAPEKIFPLIAELQAWQSWSPWEGLDPELKRSYSGASGGVGAVYAWEGNRSVGQGRMEITESVQPSRITLKLEFLKPFEAHNAAEFALERHGATTRVTWAMHGPSPFMSKLMGIVINMDRMIGTQFERGLARLKSVAEA